MFSMQCCVVYLFIYFFNQFSNTNFLLILHLYFRHFHLQTLNQYHCKIFRRLAEHVSFDGDCNDDGDASVLLLGQMIDENFPLANEDEDYAFSMEQDAIGPSSTRTSSNIEPKHVTIYSTSFRLKHCTQYFSHPSVSFIFLLFIVINICRLLTLCINHINYFVVDAMM